MTVIKIKWAFIFIFVALGAVAQADEQSGLTATLDNFHQAAARADMSTYFQTMTDDVVFLGTDGSERWQGQDFRDFVSSQFSTGRGWDYRPLERNVILAADGQTAWFDETLQNDDLGQCRGSGVLVKSAGGWKIAQYNLNVPIPNALVYEVVADIAAVDTTAAAGAVPGSVVAVPAVVEPDAAAAVTEPIAVKETITQQEAPPKPDTCRQIRFKTNRKAGC